MKYAICGLIGAFIGFIGAGVLIGVQFDRHCIRGQYWTADGFVYHCQKQPR